jgi:hypothetical protein
LNLNNIVEASRYCIRFLSPRAKLRGSWFQKKMVLLPKSFEKQVFPVLGVQLTGSSSFPELKW